MGATGNWVMCFCFSTQQKWYAANNIISANIGQTYAEIAQRLDNGMYWMEIPANIWKANGVTGVDLIEEFDPLTWRMQEEF